MWRCHNPPNTDFLLNLSSHFGSINKTNPAKFPLFIGKEILIASDYSNGQHQGEFFVISVLIIESDIANIWDRDRRVVRNEHLKDKRRLSFKALGDRRKASALPEFLGAANQLNGMLFNFCIHKSLRRGLMTDKGDLEWAKSRLGFRARWKRKTFDHLVSIASFVTFICGGLVADTQDIFWVTDDDDFTGSHIRKVDVANLLRFYRAVNHPSHSGEAIFQAVSAMPNDHTQVQMMYEDLCSIPDLAAGATAECWSTALKNHDLNISTEGIPVDLSAASDKSRRVFQWCSEDHVRMRKLSCLFVPDPDPEIQFRLLTPDVRDYFNEDPTILR